MHPYYFLEKSFWQSTELVLLFVATLFVIIFLRYFLLAAIYQWWARSTHGNATALTRKQFVREVRWSLISSAIFALLSVMMFYFYGKGYTRVYTDINDFGFPYFFSTILLYLVLYETYYYWLHRWMHMPRVFRIVHKVHHESIHTSAFTSFTFHPLEALLQFIFLPLMILIVPIHFYGLGIILALMTLSAIINHAGIEVYPKGFYKHPLGKWLIGSTHHDLHHKEFTSNFGLYFTLWDKWMNTESKGYEERFDKNNLTRSQLQRRRSTGGRHR